MVRGGPRARGACTSVCHAPQHARRLRLAASNSPARGVGSPGPGLGFGVGGERARGVAMASGGRRARVAVRGWSQPAPACHTARRAAALPGPPDHRGHS